MERGQGVRGALVGVVVLLAALALAGCEGDRGAGAVRTPTPGRSGGDQTATTATQPEDSRPVRTARLDSIAVLGHSGATGFMSDPRRPGLDAPENSWATGTNPAVRSIYRRLLRDHPSLRGHHYNGAVDGSRVSDLDAQLQTMLSEVDVAPDLVMIQTIDNDMHCDGTDDDNLRPFGSTLDRTLSRIERRLPGAQIFLVSQWATVAHWAAWARHVPAQVAGSSGDGPCDIFAPSGRIRPGRVRSMQGIVDDYWATVTRVCRRHDSCCTDGGVQKAFVPTDRDVAADHNHLSIAGHRQFAALAWSALPDAIKERR